MFPLAVNRGVLSQSLIADDPTVPGLHRFPRRTDQALADANEQSYRQTSDRSHNVRELEVRHKAKGSTIRDAVENGLEDVAKALSNGN